MVGKIFLTLVGLVYGGLALWCAIDPETTSKKVGFSLDGGSGQSEFLTVYGGLEMGMALMFLLPWFKEDFLHPMLWSCLIIHACLVAFRMLAFVLFSNMDGMTYRLAIGEWAIMILSVVVLIVAKKPH